jgi:mannose-1-phosphate guanylyltransferase
MASAKTYCLVMAGGKGTRFWPESTSKKPKQYLNLVTAESLLSDTLKRFDGLIPSERRYVVTVKEQEALAKECAEGLMNKDNFIFEPAGRNTAPCILLSLARLYADGAGDDDVVAIVPSDHVILNSKGFREVIAEASAVAGEEAGIVTIGIRPTFPHTGYGYIQSGESLGAAYSVKAFKEKPSFDTAKEYIASGDYYWNAGMFVAKLGVLKQEFQTSAAVMFKHFSPLAQKLGNWEELTKEYLSMPSDSIDYAIMEKSRRVMVIPSRFDWNDLGSWDALESVIDQDRGNTIAKASGTHFENSTGNIVFAPDKFVALIDVRDLVIVSNDKAVVVMPKSQAQKIKTVVDAIKGTEFEGLL